MNFKHGFARPGRVERLHTIWRGMLKRCSSKHPGHVRSYTGKGINVCDEWLTYINFREWAMANGYSDNLTIDRINNSKGYSPCNCRFVTNKEQARNRDSSRLIEYEGRTITVAELSEISSIPYYTLIARLNNGWTPVESASKALKTATTYNYNGTALTVSELSIAVGIKEATLRYRLKHMPFDSATKIEDKRGRWPRCRA